MRIVAIVLSTVITAAMCRGGNLDQEVRALRPADTAAGEAAVLDNLQARAASALDAIRHARTQWEADANRAALRTKLRESLGLDLLPWPPQLHSRTVGIVVRNGYHIEKLVFESLPGVLVPAHLYMPEKRNGQAPAILFYVGHWWPDAKTKPDFQAFCINMARLGFIVLSWDPFGQGERGISSRDHRRTEALLAGVAQQGFAEYETRCALQYLLSRKEVDPGRIGITGASGGGYNTWITAALDDRIKVAVPVVGTSEFYEQISVTRPLDWYHASEHCHFVPGLIRYANNHEFIAMAVPKPVLIIAAEKDQSFPIGGVRTVYQYGAGLYGAYGAREKIAFFEDREEGHGYQKKKREAAYGWFTRWLMGQADGSPVVEPETATEPFDSAELRCFRPGENQAAGPGVIEAVRRLASSLPHPTRAQVFSSTVVPANTAGAAVSAIRDTPLQRLLVPVDGSLKLPGFLSRPAGHLRGLLVVVDDRGKEEIASELPIADMGARGWAILGIDPRGIGELKTSQMGWVAAVSLLLSENFVAMQASDISRAIDVVNKALQNKNIGIYARGHNAALAATYLLGMRRDIAFYVERDGFLSLRQFYDRPRSLAQSFELKKEDRDRTTSFDREIPFAYVPFAALRYFDLPDLLAQSRARGMVASPINGDWEGMTEADARKVLRGGTEIVAGPSADTRVRDFLHQQMNK